MGSATVGAVEERLGEEDERLGDGGEHQINIPVSTERSKMRQLRALLWKIWLLKKRTPIGTFLEMLLPIGWAVVGFSLERVNRTRVDTVECPPPSSSSYFPECVEYKESPTSWGQEGFFVSTVEVLMLSFAVISTTRILVEEKEMRIKPIMAQMGMSETSYTVSFVLWGFGVYFLISVGITAFLYDSYFEGTDSNILLVFLWPFLLGLSSIPIAMFVAAFFDKTSIAALMAGCFYFVGTFPALALKEGANASERLATALLPQSAFVQCTVVFSEWIDQNKLTGEMGQITFGNFFKRGTLSVSLFELYIMMLFDALVLWPALAYYFSQVVPSASTASSRPLHFPFTREYWNPLGLESSLEGERDVATDDDAAETGGHLTNGNKDEEENHHTAVCEPVDQSLRSQIVNKVCVSIRQLSKTFHRGGRFGVEVKAVKRLNLDMYRGQITALLGHNGAGKTTTINILTGLMGADQGSRVVVNGHNIRSKHGLDAVRQSLGVCPQHNVYYRGLTVMEHLELFSAFKGVPSASVHSEAVKMLQDVGLGPKKDDEVQNLSGGQKRKLSVAIAFTGGSDFVILDEPTAGMDPFSRRSIWDVIRKFRAGRIVLLTTHFMNEADLLGDRIAIMAEGRLECVGSPLFLKNHFGAGYLLTLVKEFEEGGEGMEGGGGGGQGMARDVRAEVEAVVKAHVPKAVLMSNVASEIAFQLPKAASGLDLGALLTRLEEEKASLGISSFGLSMTTMEEVFIRIAKGMHDVKVREEVSERRQSVERQMSNASIRTEDDNEKLRRQSSLDRQKSNGSIAESVGNGNMATAADVSPTGVEAPRAVAPFWEHVRALLIKRFLLFRKDWKIGLYTLAIAPIYTIVILAIFRNLKLEKMVMVLPAVPILLIGISYIPAAWASFVVKERESMVKYQQVVSGVRLKAYWLSVLVFDVALYTIVAFLLIIFLKAWELPLIHSARYAGATILLFLLYGPASALFTYVLSFLFKSSTNVIAIMQFLHLILSLVLGVLVLVLFVINSTKPEAKVLRWVFRIFPPYCLADGLCFLLRRVLMDKDDGMAYDWTEGIGGDLLFLGIDTVLYGGLLYVCEQATVGSNAISKAYANWRLPKTLQHESAKPDGGVWDEDLKVRAIDEDVRREAARIEESAAAGVRDVISIEGIKKAFPLGAGTSSNKLKGPMGNVNFAVRGVDFGIKEGECFGLLGTNGAGKSTLLKMLCGELPATEGKAFIDGLDVSLHPTVVHERVGYCPQFDAHWGVLTARQHLEFYSRIKGVPAGERDALIDSLVNDMGLTVHQDKAAASLSGGNRRKLSLAMAIVGNPRVIFLDEPSAGVDPLARRFLWDVLSETAAKRRHCAIVLTTHSMEECEALCQRLCIMVTGRLRCLGAVQHIKSRFGSNYQLDVTLALPSEEECLVAQREIMSSSPQTQQKQQQQQVVAVSEEKAPEEGAEAVAVITAPNPATFLGWPALVDVLQRIEPAFVPMMQQQKPGGGMVLADAAAWLHTERKSAALIRFVADNCSVASGAGEGGEGEKHEQLLERVGSHLTFSLQQEGTGGEGAGKQMPLGAIFSTIEKQREALGIRDYSLAQATLEQIFNRIAGSDAKGESGE